MMMRSGSASAMSSEQLVHRIAGQQFGGVRASVPPIQDRQLVDVGAHPGARHCPPCLRGCRAGRAPRAGPAFAQHRGPRDIGVDQHHRVVEFGGDAHRQVHRREALAFAGNGAGHHDQVAVFHAGGIATGPSFGSAAAFDDAVLVGQARSRGIRRDDAGRGDRSRSGSSAAAVMARAAGPSSAVPLPRQAGPAPARMPPTDRFLQRARVRRRRRPPGSSTSGTVIPGAAELLQTLGGLCRSDWTWCQPPARRCIRTDRHAIGASNQQDQPPTPRKTHQLIRRSWRRSSSVSKSTVTTPRNGRPVFVPQVVTVGERRASCAATKR